MVGETHRYISSTRSGNKMKFQCQLHLSVSRPPGRHSRSLPSSNWPTLATFSPADTKHVARSLSYSVRLSVVAPFAILGRHRRKITTGSSSP